MEKIEVNKETLDGESSEIHLLPCKISHDGKCDVKSYFSSSIMKKTSNEDQKENQFEVLENGLRGRPLNGLLIKFGDSKLGLVIDEKTKGESKSFKACGHFNQIYSWHLDEPKLNEKTETFNKAMGDWFSAMKIIHE